MKSVKIIAFAAAMSIPSLAQAQEAFVAQIGGFTANVTVPAPQAAPVNVQSVVSSLTVPVFEAPLSQTISVSAPVFDFSDADFGLIELTSGQAVAEVTSVGDNNTAQIVQNGFHAASIVQNGTNLTAAITQTGAGNRASVYQFGANRTALVSQAGSGNRAVVIQN